ncbi:MAG: SurA N-terminal domain-containing protein [Nautiliaceae bacterium]|jgi:peptidyl-prolyl cis-trans isomerase D
MIEWMQTHRKWMVITIWIATIAFIGAGFVGWGQFQFGSKSSTLVKIGDVEVSIQDVQKEYNKIFALENQKLNGKLDEATAEKMGLKKEAFQAAIQAGILRAFAKDIGLYITDKEVAEYILNTFKTKQNYFNYLKSIGEKPAIFEANLKKDLLIQKLLNSLHLKPSKTFLISNASALFNADNLDIKIINQNSIKVELSEDEIKSFWEKNKDKFKSPQMFKIAIVKTPLKGEVSEEKLKTYYKEHKNEYKNEKGEILPFEKAKNQVKFDVLAQKNRKTAILAYKKLKEGKENYELVTLPLQNETIPLDKMLTLISKGYLKPFIADNEYISAKLVEEIKPKPLAYEKAKPYVIKELMAQKSINNLKKTAQEMLKDFKGKNIGFVTKYDFNKIKGLSPQEAVMFLFKEFESQKSKDYIIVQTPGKPLKAVLYNIKEQKLLDKKKYEKYKRQIEKKAEEILNAILFNDLINDLSKKLNITTVRQVNFK